MDEYTCWQSKWRKRGLEIAERKTAMRELHEKLLPEINKIIEEAQQ